MKTLPLDLAALVAVSLSGCFGGSPHASVLLSCNATGPDGAAVPLPAQFGVDLATPWGRTFANKVVNTTIASPAVVDGHSYCAIIETPQEFQRVAATQTYDTAQFTELVGMPIVGMRFSAFSYNATMVAVDAKLVTFELAARDGQRSEFPQYGLALTHRSESGDRVQVLEPIVGATFRILQPNQIALPLPVGSFRALPAANGHLRYGYVASTDISLLNKPLDVAVTILAIQRDALPAPSGLYGARVSPQVLGDVTPFLGGRLPASEPQPAATHADDGHTH